MMDVQVTTELHLLFVLFTRLIVFMVVSCLGLVLLCRFYASSFGYHFLIETYGEILYTYFLRV